MMQKAIGNFPYLCERSIGRNKRTRSDAAEGADAGSLNVVDRYNLRYSILEVAR